MQWWREGEIVLCFDWGKFWLNSLIQEWEQTEKAEWEKNFINPGSSLPDSGPNLFLSLKEAELHRKKRKSYQDILNNIANLDDAERLVVPRYGEISAWWAGKYDDPMPAFDVRPYGIDSNFKPMCAPHLCETCDQGTEHWKSLFASLSRSNLILPKTEAEKVYGLLFPNMPPLPGKSDNSISLPVNKYAERHAANREQLYKVAIGVLADYPNECRGPRKEMSPEKWAQAILDHVGEYPPLQILDKGTITDHLRAAVNVKSRFAHKGGE